MTSPQVCTTPPLVHKRVDKITNAIAELIGSTTGEVRMKLTYAQEILLAIIDC